VIVGPADAAALLMGGGGIGAVGKSLFDFLRHRTDTTAKLEASRAKAEADREAALSAATDRRERSLWTEIGKLQGKVEALEKRLDSITAENVRLMLENAALKNEVDDLLEAQGKPTKYHTPSMTTTTTTTTIQQPGINKS
jgi:regulator of replication initiation timing